jgi:hypothetical protein
MPEMSVINMIWLLLPVCDWPIMMIGPGCLLLEVPVMVVWVGLEKKVDNYTWMWKIFLQDHIVSIAGDSLRYIPHVGSSSHVKYKAFRCSFDYSKPQVLKDDSQIWNRANSIQSRWCKFLLVSGATCCCCLLGKKPFSELKSCPDKIKLWVSNFLMKKCAS